MIEFAIETISASKTRDVFTRGTSKSFNSVGLSLIRHEPLRQRRTYFSRDDMIKDLRFLGSKAWPESNSKSAWFVSVIMVEPTSGIVWC